MGINAQETGPGSKNAPSVTTSQTSDELIKHLRAAETHQVAGDLINAAVENRAVLGIALQRMGRIAIEKGEYEEAVNSLSESLKFADTAPNRTNLAIAYLRQNLYEKADIEAQIALAIDPNHIGAHYILGNIYYTKEDYKAARPELEIVFAKAPDLEIARALGLTYLNLKEIETARNHFEKMRSLVGTESADLALLFAKFYERTNYPLDAERELKRALEIEPLKPKISFYLGYLLLQNGGSERMKEAGEAFEKELEINPNDFYSIFFTGVVASAEHDHKKAISFFERAVGINPESGEAHLFLAQSQLEMDDLANAEKHLRRAVELEANGGKNTQSRRTHFMLGRLLLRTGRKEEGLKELAIAGELQKAALDSSRSEISRILGQVAEKSEEEEFDTKGLGPNIKIDLTPERTAQLEKLEAFLSDVIAQAYSNLGVIATQNNQLYDAIENFTVAYRWKPAFPNLSRNLGIVTFRAGDHKKAIEPLTRHLESNPQDILIRKMLGSSHYLTNNYAKSVEVLKPVEAMLASDPELGFFYGISLVRVERVNEAIPFFVRLSAASQENAPALSYAAQGFMIAGDYNRAVKEFERVLVLAPGTPKANYFIGQSLIRLNRVADAEKFFSRELEINPRDALSKYHLALTLIERKIETDRAVKNLEEAISLRYGYADAHYQLGKIYLEKGNYKQAIAELESAVLADAEKDYIHYQLSIAYRKASRKADADRELKLYRKLKDEKRKSDRPMPMGGNDDSPQL